MDGSLSNQQRRELGFSVVELLIVLAILGIVLSIGIFNGRQALAAQEQRSAVTSIQQSVWQGATAASARGEIVTLRREGQDLVLRVGHNGRVLRTETMPDGVKTNIRQGTILVFTPPGRIAAASLAEAGDLWVETGAGRHHLEFSVIGELRVK